MSLYLRRYGYTSRLIESPPPQELELCVVIPSFCEPDITTTLQSLAACKPILGKVEVITVLNQSSSDPKEVFEQNQKTLEDIQRWQAAYQGDLICHTIHETLPPKYAGVGLARKIGMDEACRRFNHLKKDGVIVCLDADCTCDTHYLQALWNHFRTDPHTPGCSIYFEHPLENKAIAEYELHLRYYTHALRYCGLPCAFQTVGSAMAVRCSAYEKQGGMNKRKAGEDFYFLQKIIKLGGFTELKNTTVYPSARLSYRVPFGTGKAMSDYLQSKKANFTTYDPSTFKDLKNLVLQVPQLHQASEPQSQSIWNTFPAALQGFIKSQDFIALIEDFNQNTSSFASFQKRFFQWCDGFLALKCANYARTENYGAMEVTEAASWLLAAAYDIDAAGNNVRELLMQYRSLDKDQVS